MLKPSSPLQKLFKLQDLKHQIEQDIKEFWRDSLRDESKIMINRDENISIMLFIIVKA